MPKKLRIANRLVGDGEPTLIIAEAGINHNGSLEIAKTMIEIAATAGADVIKFQKRHLPSIYRRDVLENPNDEGQNFQYLIPLLQEVELSEEDYHEIVEHCRKHNIIFLCTPWDKTSVDFLEELEVPAYKIASADMTNFELLEYVASKGKPMIVSTGMSTMEEIERTVRFLEDMGAEFMLMHCNSTYPTPTRDVNLRFIQTLKQFGVPVGYSGHERGIVLTAVAVAMGACAVERHFTLDRTMPGPDHAASIEPEGLTRLVKYIRAIEQALGDGTRRVSRGEEVQREALGKSIVTTCFIPKGTIITRDMLTAKSPGRGISPQHIPDIVGKRAARDIPEETQLSWDDLEEVRQNALRSESAFPRL